MKELRILLVCIQLLFVLFYNYQTFEVTEINVTRDEKIIKGIVFYCYLK